MEQKRADHCGARIAVLAALIVLNVSVAAKELPLSVALSPHSVNGDTAQDVAISPDGRFISYTLPARDDPEATQLWIRPSSGGTAHVVLDTRLIGPAQPKPLSEEAMKLLERRHAYSGYNIEYRWRSDGLKMLASAGEQLFLIDPSSGTSETVTPPGDRVADPHLAMGGRWMSFVRDHNLFLRDLKSGLEHAVADDANDSVFYGAPDFVTQEEIQRFTGAWWSPDGRRIAYTRTDQSRVREVQRVKIDADAISVVKERYPITGTANSEVRVLIGDTTGAPPVQVDLGPDTDIYVYQVIWAPDGKTLYVERQSRDQKRLDLLAVEPTTGGSHVLVSETSDTWVELERDFKPLADGTFLWGSARTGWQHLYLYSHEGQLIRVLTSGEWRLANLGATGGPDESPIVSVDEKAGMVYFIASIETPTEQQLYRISYRHKDSPHLVTQGHGWWVPVMAPNNPDVIAATYSDPQTPPRCALYDGAGRRIEWITENKLDATHPLFPYLDQRPDYVYGTIKAPDGETLHYIMARPHGFDPSRRYPAIVKVYGGPNVQTVKRNWHSSDQLLTQEGYIVFQLDNRGSANRSEKFEHAIYGALGYLSTVDQLAGIDFLRSLPFVDVKRVGMFGWSFGAYETVRTMTWPTGNSGITAGIAGGTPSDFRLYDTHYTERYLGKPQDHAAAYQEAALVSHAKDLKGHLLLMHGLSDDNVVLTNFSNLVSELQTQGKIFDTDVFPGQGHAIRGLQAQVRQWDDYLRFFRRTLQGDLDCTGKEVSINTQGFCH